MEKDLSAVAGEKVSVTLNAVNADVAFNTIPGACIDHLACAPNIYEPDAALLKLGEGDVENEQLFSHVFKSNCPVTGQPDWATVWLAYSGKKIDELSLLNYLVSYRNHQGFHEACVENIFRDIQARCEVTELCVYARYTRRGGLDINPFRVTSNWQDKALPFTRLLRQ